MNEDFYKGILIKKIVEILSPFMCDDSDLNELEFMSIDELEEILEEGGF